MVLVRVRILAHHGVSAIKFGSIDKSDFAIPPVALLYGYLIVAGALGWPVFGQHELFGSRLLQWVGIGSCACSLVLMALSLISFGSSFRVGIDTEHPDALVTSGVFGITRNPIYVAFAFVLIGEFLIQPYPLLLAYAVAGAALFHRQVLREEAFLRQHYGSEYEEYCRRVPRYV